jgi:hypothetical protein
VHLLSGPLGAASLFNPDSCSKCDWFQFDIRNKLVFRVEKHFRCCTQRARDYGRCVMPVHHGISDFTGGNDEAHIDIPAFCVSTRKGDRNAYRWSSERGDAVRKGIDSA